MEMALLFKIIQLLLNVFLDAVFVPFCATPEI